MIPALCPNGCGELDAPARIAGKLHRSCPACGYSRPLSVAEMTSMGGKASSDKLTPAERSERARRASRAYRDNLTDEDRAREREQGIRSARKRWGKE